MRVLVLLVCFFSSAYHWLSKVKGTTTKFLPSFPILTLEGALLAVEIKAAIMTVFPKPI